jgi:hypothetical protein
MITDLELNAYHHLQKRLRWLTLVAKVAAEGAETDPDHGNFLQEIVARSTPLSSITRVKLSQLGHSIMTPV